MNKFIYSLVSGILIGTCMILPGVSGSVVAIMLGVYEQLIFVLNNKDIGIISKIKKTMPLALGIVIGILIFGKVLLFFYKNYSFQMMYVFMGLILGSINVLINDIKGRNLSVSNKHILFSLFLSLIIFVAGARVNLNITNKLNVLNLFFGGFLYIGGKIVPGISSSFFLMMLGLYDYFLEMVANPFNFTFNVFLSLLPFFIGIIFGLYFFLKLIGTLIDKHFEGTYSSIIGFIVGSIIMIFPGIEISIRGFTSIFLMVVSYFLLRKMTKK